MVLKETELKEEIARVQFWATDLLRRGFSEEMIVMGFWGGRYVDLRSEEEQEDWLPRIGRDGRLYFAGEDGFVEEAPENLLGMVRAMVAPRKTQFLGETELPSRLLVSPRFCGSEANRGESVIFEVSDRQYRDLATLAESFFRQEKPPPKSESGFLTK